MNDAAVKVDWSKVFAFGVIVSIFTPSMPVGWWPWLLMLWWHQIAFIGTWEIARMIHAVVMPYEKHEWIPRCTLRRDGINLAVVKVCRTSDDPVCRTPTVFLERARRIKALRDRARHGLS